MIKINDKVCCIGQGIIDYVILAPDLDGLLEKGKCNKLEMENLNNLLQTFSKDSIIYKDIGGAVTNTSFNMSHIGLENFLSLSIGENDYSFFREKLEALPNLKPLIQVNKDTGKVITFIPKEKDCNYVSYTNAFSYGDANKISPDGVLEKAIEDSFLLYTSFYSFYGEGFDAHEKILHNAKKKSKIIAIDAGGCKNFEDMDKLRYLIKEYADIIFVNDAESEICGIENNIAEFSKNVNIIVRKMGDKGSKIYNGKDPIFVPTKNVEVVNSLGAGDAYSAGFIYGLSKGYSLYDSGIMGTMVSLKVIKDKNLRLTSPTTLKH